jgi:hypothetical protein
MGYAFGMHNGHLKAQADRIAEKHGAWHVNYTEPNGRRRGWFECQNRGAPFDGDTAKEVLADVEAAGGFEKLTRRQKG